ncbi:hypothetical protein [Baaleninema sp.]|uniref:hypothetical protein n=1 Tax=Baaleninema sp. TaxID=3101197 RepID=UPI003CFED0BB
MHSSPATPEAFRPSAASAAPSQKPQGGDRTRTEPRLTVALVSGGATLGVLALLAGIYALTRPCVVGSCDRLERAETLSRNALSTLEAEPTTESFVQARQGIDAALAELEPIPPWSLQNKKTQQLEERLQGREQELIALNPPLTGAMKAAEMSQNPPHSLREWRQMERLWEQSIAQLEAIPPDNIAHSFAQAKVEEYQNNLDAVRRRAILERRGEEQLEAARSAAEVARTRQSNARDLAGWQQVYATWRTAVRALMRVPNGTTSADTAQDLVRNYGPQLNAAQQRQTQEQIAKNLYDRALTLADEAKTAQERQDWDRAVVKWQQALGYSQQIPSQTAYSDRVPALVRGYTNALVQAIAAQQLNETIDRAKRDLARVCGGTPKMCQYQVSGDRIVVKLLPDYVERVRQLDIEAVRQNNTQAQAQLNEHIQRSIDSLELISLNAGIPLKVLNPDGEEIGAFVPGS